MGVAYLSTKTRCLGPEKAERKWSGGWRGGRFFSGCGSLLALAVHARHGGGGSGVASGRERKVRIVFLSVRDWKDIGQVLTETWEDQSAWRFGVQRRRMQALKSNSLEKFLRFPPHWPHSRLAKFKTSAPTSDLYVCAFHPRHLYLLSEFGKLSLTSRSLFCTGWPPVCCEWDDCGIVEERPTGRMMRTCRTTISVIASFRFATVWKK